MDYSPEQLLIQCQKGKPHAQRVLYERYKTLLFAICLRYARDYGHAEDLLQEAFMVIFRDISAFRNEGSLEGWLRRVTSRVAITQLRKKYPTQFAEPFLPRRVFPRAYPKIPSSAPRLCLLTKRYKVRC